ncbi:dethiobiotin synthase [Paenibacillus tarimensis]|uniref:dethiobiotin synthase n=1 Tax=Paenibacillus tarimensis TaxID=416012 RepID=UPI001F3BF66A|nr:dethiobiotin synthase [Paenibacillus tarimensis]MCF2943003.1 dethiobiotin synthase [Paenibacillus tarimensis]
MSSVETVRGSAAKKPLFPGLFVAGTDTGVGKTLVTAALAAALREEGRNIGVWKPVQSGVLIGSGASDAERLLQGSGVEERPEAVASFTFEEPLTPVLAAERAGVDLSMDDLLVPGIRLAERYGGGLLVEGAGGVAVPLTKDALVIDLIVRLGLPVLIAARSGLGTINHTLLTAEALRARGIPVVGAVLNDGAAGMPADDPSVSSNAAMIEKYGGIKVLGRLPRLNGEAGPVQLADKVRRSLDLERVRRLLDEGKIN